jgi:fatty acid desaturase
VNAEILKTAATGILSSWLRNAVTVAATCLTAAHPRLAAFLLPPGWESALPWIVGVLAAFLMALLSHVIRQARHSRLFDEAFQAGIDAAAPKPSPFPTVPEIRQP